MKRKKLKIPLIVLSSVLVLLIAGVIWQWNNIEAVILYKSFSKKEIEEKLSSEKAEAENAISKIPGGINDLTEDEKKKLISGAMTQEEAIKIIVERSKSSGTTQQPGASDIVKVTEKPSSGASGSSGGTTNSGGSTSSGNTGGTVVSSAPPKAEPIPTPSVTPVPALSPDEQRIKELVAKLYVLRAQYIDTLDKLIAQAKSEYLALPASERTSAGKQKVLLKYLGQASAMESSCDASVNELLAELSTLLQKTGGDMSLIDEIKKTYRQEKSLKKAAYISQFSKL